MNPKTYDQLLLEALFACAARGRDALREDAVLGRSCKCGDCWSCAAWEAYHSLDGGGLACPPKLG